MCGDAATAAIGHQGDDQAAFGFVQNVTIGEGWRHGRAGIRFLVLGLRFWGLGNDKSKAQHGWN